MRSLRRAHPRRCGDLRSRAEDGTPSARRPSSPGATNLHHRSEQSSGGQRRRSTLRWQRKTDTGSATSAAFGPDAATLSLHEPSGDSEAETCASVRPRRLATPERLEHARVRFLVDSVARVFDGHANLVRQRRHANRDGTVARRVPECVGQEVHQDALDLLRSEVGGRSLCDVGDQTYLTQPRLGLDAEETPRDDSRDGKVLELECELACVDPREL